MGTLGAGRDEARERRDHVGSREVPAEEAATQHGVEQVTTDLKMPSGFAEEARIIIAARDKAIALLETYLSLGDKMKLPMLLQVGNENSSRHRHIRDAICEELNLRDIPFVEDYDKAPIHHGAIEPFSLRVASTEEAVSPSLGKWITSAYSQLFAPELKLEPMSKREDLRAAISQWGAVGIASVIGLGALSATCYSLLTLSQADWMMSVIVIGMCVGMSNIFGQKALQAAHSALAERMTQRVEAAHSQVDKRS